MNSELKQALVAAAESFPSPASAAASCEITESQLQLWLEAGMRGDPEFAEFSREFLAAVARRYQRLIDVAEACATEKSQSNVLLSLAELCWPQTANEKKLGDALQRAQSALYDKGDAKAQIRDLFVEQNAELWSVAREAGFEIVKA